MIILMNGIESEAVRFQHAAARMNPDLEHLENAKRWHLAGTLADAKMVWH